MSFCCLLVIRQTRLVSALKLRISASPILKVAQSRYCFLLLGLARRRPPCLLGRGIRRHVCELCRDAAHLGSEFRKSQ